MVAALKGAVRKRLFYEFVEDRLPYRWIGEISQMERKKLQDTLQSSLNEVSRHFNSELGVAAAALMPTNAEVDRMGREQAYERRYAQWKNSSATPKLFSRIGIAWDQDGELTLRMLKLEKGNFEPAEWPATWSGMRDQITARLRHGPGGGPPFETMRTIEATTVFEQPRFGDPGPPETAPSRSRLGNGAGSPKRGCSSTVVASMARIVSKGGPPPGECRRRAVIWSRVQGHATGHSAGTKFPVSSFSMRSVSSPS